MLTVVVFHVGETKKLLSGFFGILVYLESDAKHNNENTRAALDRIADRLINDAVEFASDIVEDAKNLAKRHGVPEETIPEAPKMANILVRQKWRTDKDYGRARKALTSPHFEDRIRKSRNRQEA
jgi:hypothetical protein